jgi:hypothetical protein
MRVYKHVGAISNIFSSLTKYEKCRLFVLMYRHPMNILIVYGRCTGTFGSLCIMAV